MEIIKGGVTAAKGFCAAGLNAGIKNNEKKDMAMVYSEKPCVTAGTFTTNKVFAAPVKWDKDIVANSPFAQAVVVNSGVANACTGKEGDDACAAEAKAVSEALQVPESAVLPLPVLSAHSFQWIKSVQELKNFQRSLAVH